MRFSIEAVFQAVDRFTRPVAKIQGRMNKFTDLASRGILKLGTAAINVAGRFAAIGAAAAAAGVAIGGIALAKNIIDVGSDFEQAIVNVGAVGLQTRGQIASLEKKALELGSTTKFTATEAANAMEIMARAGFKNEEILAGVDGVLSAAAASGLEMAEVADVVSNVLKGMGLEAGEASRVSDVLALASSRTNSTIGTLGESMKNLSPVARQMGVSLEEAVASVALLQDVGLDASEAGTATATMLTKLTKPIPEVAKQMKKLGIEFEDANHNALPLPKILQQFDVAAKKSGGNMKVIAFFADLVGLRGQKAALNLKEMFASGKLSTLTEELDNALGTSQKMSELRMDSLQGDWTLLGSAVDGVKVALFDMEGGPLRKIVQTTTEWVTANKELIKEKFEVVAKFVQLVADKAPEAIPALVKWAKFFGIITAAVAAVIGVLLGASLIFMAVFVAPITAAAAAWAFFPDFVSGLWDDVKGTTSSFANFFVGIFESIKSFFVTAFNFIKGVVFLTWSAIKENFGPQVEFFQNILFTIRDLFGIVFGAISERIEGEVAGLKTLWTGFKDMLGGVWDFLVAAYEKHVKPILDSVMAFVDRIATIGANTETGGVATLGTGGGFGASVQSAQGAVLRELKETKSTELVELRIHDPSGSAEVKRQKQRGSNLSVESTGTD